MWTAFYLGEESENFKIIVMNHQIPKTLEAVGTRLEHLKHNVLEFCRISFWQNCWNIFSDGTFMEKYDIAYRPVQFHWHMFPGHTAIQIE